MPEHPASQLASPAALYLASLAPSTRRVMAGDLRAVARLAFGAGAGDIDAAPWPTLDAARWAEVRASLAARYAPGTANRVLSAARGVIRACWRCGALPWDVHLRLLASLPPVRGGRVARGRALTWPEVERLLAAAAGLEERALLATLAGAGLRRAEALALTWDRFTRHDRTFYLRAVGKGNKERRLRVPVWAARALSAWRARCPERDRVFRWRDGKSVYVIVSRTARRAGLAPLAPHDLRRTFYSLCRRTGLDTRTIQRAMGHASISTTVKYDRRPDEEALAEMERLDSLVPDRA